MRFDVDFRHTAQIGESTALPFEVKVKAKGGMEKVLKGTVQQPQLETLALKHVANIPDGQTMAVSVGRCMADVRTESSVPILSRIPYVNRLVTNTGVSRETVELFLFVTPRIVIQEPTEIPAWSIVPLD